MAFYVYMLLCADNAIYSGHTDDLEARLIAHRRRLYCGYTAKRLPVRLIFADTFATRDEAFAVERQIKGWSRAKKLALAEWDWELVQRLALRRTPQPEEYRRRTAPGSRTSP
jgi:predicted GIY-YIG superfamily endonuclease